MRMRMLLWALRRRSLPRGGKRRISELGQETYREWVTVDPTSLMSSFSSMARVWASVYEYTIVALRTYSKVDTGQMLGGLQVEPGAVPGGLWLLA